ncbi:acetylornithine deacetylase [uncultured Legionella sp.]|uniref:acetylornithine deacetylase n=1 Tax=uncultured Legionella sp. TaxID=210934 RepID=UPI002604966A|nr:acetylornithine deacetylase [uncultured Legionella sp.]
MTSLQWLKKLISINTVSSNSNLPLIAEIKGWFELHEINYHIIPGANEDKANLLAIIPGHDGTISGGLILSGHTDVVPVTGQNWNTDPFIPVELDGKIYGRGACDMKGFLAVLLALAPEFKKMKLAKPLYLAFTFDEEIGCIGVDYLVEFLQKNKIHPEGCIVGEPSSMRPVVGEKRRRLYHCQVMGKAIHSSLAPLGCNAIEYASRLICYINDLARHTQQQGPFDSGYDIPFTTITINVINGGIATNIVPGSCEFIVELRYLHEFPILNFEQQILNYIDSDLVPLMKKTYPDAAIHFEEHSDSSGFVASEDSQLNRIVRTVTGINERYKVSFSTEAEAYQSMRIPTLICGPGDIHQAHTPNEFICISQLELCEKVLKNVVHFFCEDKKSIN